MTGDITFRNYIRNATDDRRVRSDLSRMYENYRTQGAGLFDGQIMRRMEDRGHAQEVSRALQRIERMAGNDGDFRTQGLVDMAQQEYDGEASQIHRRYRSADHDGHQNYWRNDGGNLAMADRAAAHNPTDRLNAAEASQFIQQREVQAIGSGDLFGAQRIDRKQERFERQSRIANGWMSQDAEGRGISTADHVRNAFMLFGWLGLMR
jgi:hypothetical protein